MKGSLSGSLLQGTPKAWSKKCSLALNSPDELEKMAWRSYSAGVAMSMPQVVREYIRSFRQQERIKTLQLAAGMRRRGEFQRPDKLPAPWAKRIQKWQDEDEIKAPRLAFNLASQSSARIPKANTFRAPYVTGGRACGKYAECRSYLFLRLVLRALRVGVVFGFCLDSGAATPAKMESASRPAVRETSGTARE